MAMIKISMFMIIPNKPTCRYLHPLSDNKTVSRLLLSHASHKASSTNNFNAHDHVDRSPITRRSGNYNPPLWDYEYIQSLSSEYTEDVYIARASELKMQVRKMLMKEMSSVLDQLKFIDDLHRLGVSYQFENEITLILNQIYEQKYCDQKIQKASDLYSTALEFRVLRQYGFSVSQEVFDCFKNEKNEFMESLVNDTKGLFELYEASYLMTEDEDTLELAQEFAMRFLQKKLDYDEQDFQFETDHNLSQLVRRALELPVHWRVQRPNVRWYIDAYERRPDMNETLLEFAKLDFNVIQASYQQELKQISRWWKQTCLAEKLPFARDRIVENYYWTIGVLCQPQYRQTRIMAAKVNAIVTTIDDIFDVYGTLEELQLFNDVIQRWDMDAIDKLPDYMQICFLALNNFVNEMAYAVLKEQGILVIKHLRKSWADLSGAYLQEAKWFSMGYTPSFNEYINNAWISISAPTILTSEFFYITNPIRKEAVESLYKYHDVVKYSAMLLRLANDLGTSPVELKRGDVPKSVECYMNETGASRQEAREYIMLLIKETWKKMNKERIVKAKDSPFSQTFITSAADLGRMAQNMYYKGDGHGTQNYRIKDQMSGVIFEPVL